MAPGRRRAAETDQQLRWAVERGLQVAAEALFDAGAHVLAAEFQEAVDEYRQIPKRLLAHGVLSAATTERLKGLAGFRNVVAQPVQARRKRRGAVAPDARRLKSVALQRQWRQNGAMPSVQIKDVPDQTHAVLKRRAADAGQSLQEYLRTKLIEDASRPTVNDVLERAAGRAGGSLTLKAAVRAVRNDRDRR